MKKVLALTLLSLSFASSYAFAATEITTGNVPAAAAISIYGGNSLANATAAQYPLIKLSAKVSAVINWEQAAQAQGLSTGYSIGTKHIDGSKIFGTAWNSTTIYFKQDASGTALTGTKFGSDTGNANFIVDGWTAY